MSVSAGDRPGEPLLDHFAPSLLEEPLYYADGQIRDEVYVYGSFLQARKHERGVRCSDCHDPHSARLIHEGNALCAQCHQPEAPLDRFPTLRKAAYDTPAHHFHAPGTPGSFCVDCHMPATTYMQVDPRRDHSFTVPRPDQTMRTGTHNACNSCHYDRTPAWALEEIVRRFPTFATARVPAGHFGQVLTAARRADPQAFATLVRLAQEQGEPAIVRATAVQELQRYEPSAAVRAIAPTLMDADALVRATAARAIGVLIPEEAPAGLHQQKVHVLERLLDDPVRHVRSEAARALAGAAEAQIPAARKAAFTAALDGWIGRQEALADRPDPHLNLGVLQEIRGQARAAEASYR
ncbi:MAG: HEAT repeat domain-containing protein, partial [Planctomycetota bacterium]|nr:HEAT repeat domain-containing protein [Planctomycetota bacterium]